MSIIYQHILKVMSDEKPKRRPLEIEIFLLRGVNERGLEGVRSLLKPSSAFLINKKIKILNVLVDNRQVPY